jgi:hypothetical protein
MVGLVWFKEEEEEEEEGEYTSMMRRRRPTHGSLFLARDRFSLVCCVMKEDDVRAR